MIIRELGMIVFGLLCGSILFGRALPKWIKGIDVTEVSNDHNPGTANAMKYAGVPVGILCLLGDLLKGALPVYVAVGMGLVTDSWFPLIMAAPVLGHAYSLFYHGNGGKAIAVSFGVLIGLGTSPERIWRCFCASALGSGIGTAESRALEYGCSVCAYRSSEEASSTTLPRYITAIRSLMAIASS